MTKEERGNFIKECVKLIYDKIDDKKMRGEISEGQEFTILTNIVASFLKTGTNDFGKIFHTALIDVITKGASTAEKTPRKSKVN